jgi:hypothetical protein
VFGTRSIFATRRPRLAIGLTLGMATLVMAWGLAVPSALADSPGCPDGHVCWWSDTNFNGDRLAPDCGVRTWEVAEKHSAKNRCNTPKRMDIAWLDGNGDLNYKACLDPGENRPDPGRFNIIVIGSGQCPT